MRPTIRIVATTANTEVICITFTNLFLNGETI